MRDNLLRLKTEGEHYISLNHQSSTETMQTSKSNERRLRAQRKSKSRPTSSAHTTQIVHGGPQNAAKRASIHDERKNREQSREPSQDPVKSQRKLNTVSQPLSQQQLLKLGQSQASSTTNSIGRRASPFKKNLSPQKSQSPVQKKSRKPVY